MAAEVVQDDNITLEQRGGQHLFDRGAEGAASDRPVDHPRAVIPSWRRAATKAIPRHFARTVYGGLLLGKGPVFFWRLVGWGHVFGVWMQGWIFAP